MLSNASMDRARIELSALEIDALSTFTLNDIMTNPVRERLRESWGLCSRHAWGQAAVELEFVSVVTATAPATFECALLYDDLLRSMRLILGSKWLSPHRALSHRGTCPLCSRLRHMKMSETADSAEVKPLLIAGQLITESAQQWGSRQCPECSRSATGNIRCRPHLLEAGVDDKGPVLKHLAELQHRLRSLIGSMSSQRDQNEPRDHSAWVETLGWFHGWDIPQFLYR